MAKYSKEDLKAKAKYVVANEGTSNYLQLIMQLSIKSKITLAETERRIRNLAHG